MGLEHLTCVWGSLDGPELTALCVQNFYFWGTDLRNKRVNNTHRIQKETQLKKKHMMFEAEGTHPFFEKKMFIIFAGTQGFRFQNWLKQCSHVTHTKCQIIASAPSISSFGSNMRGYSRAAKIKRLHTECVIPNAG